MLLKVDATMIEYKYILEPYRGMNTRFTCPNCQHRAKTFSLYIDRETGEQLNHSVGRCNREINCGFHYTPKQYFQDNNISFDTPQPKSHKPLIVANIQKPISFIAVDLFKASLKAHTENNFVKFLVNLFGVEVASELVSRYFIATSKHWNGATVFWQIDTQGKVRTGKIMLYSPVTGKRVKNIDLPVYWVHKALKQPEFTLGQCLFGEHLLIDKTKPVAIVESEKTAVIASVYLPQFIWVAVGSLTSLNAEKCGVLKGRNVTLFPDLNGYDKWNIKAKQLSHLANFTVSELLERKATDAEREQGYDLADYLLKHDYKSFATPETKAPNTKTAFQFISESKSFEQTEQVYYFSKPEIPNQESWEQDINELENYFTNIAIPTEPVKLNQCSTVANYSLFIKSHFAFINANKSKRTFLPYLNRLQELKGFMESSLKI